MSAFNFPMINNNNNQQQPPPTPLNRQNSGVYGGNQSPYGGNQLPYGGNQSPYGGNQLPYGGNQLPYGANQFNYRRSNNNNYYDPNRNFNLNQNQNFNRRNTYYNRNRRTNFINNGYDNGGYGIVSQVPRQFNGPRRNYPVQRQGRQVFGQQQRPHGPQQRRLSDFMPAEFRSISPNVQQTDVPNLPSDFNLVSNTAVAAPVNALPQRQPRQVTGTNVTQPFNINNNMTVPDQQPQQQQQQRINLQQQQQITTASFRRRQRRLRQEQFRSNAPLDNNNRFAGLENEDILPDVENIDDVAKNNKPKGENIKKKKQRLYLEPNRIMRYMQDNSSTIVSGRGNQAYTLATTSIYDEWVRNNYELQVWQTYLKMGTEQKHWAKEVIQRTKKRDEFTNTRFIQKKINRLTTDIARLGATISDMQIQLSTYWNQTTAVIQTNNTNTATTTTTSSTTTNRARDPVDRLEKCILKYIHHCTQHIKKLAETRIQLAKAQMEEFKALQDFEQVATPLQWNIHLTLKPKMKTWSTKNKNYRLSTKRVEYDLPPKFISKTDLSFKLDESILGQEEAQVIYNQMRQLTKEFRTQAMTLYLQSTTREYELLSNQINQIIKGFPQENDDGFDAEAGSAAFKHYYDLREKRYNLEVEQSIYFLDEQRVEGEINLQQEEILAPTLTRSLGEDFLLQQ